jgi:hypothetical protein
MADICISYSKNNILTFLKKKKTEEKKLRKKIPGKGEEYAESQKTQRQITYKQPKE